jgi:predicted dehydrogenase
MPDNLILVGAGGMTLEYVKVLRNLRHEFTVVGRGRESGVTFFQNSGIMPFLGGVDRYLAECGAPDTAIVAVGIEALAEVAAQLLNSGCRRLLVEKPGGNFRREIEALAYLSDERKAKTLIAYNRRFYAATFAAEERIQADGGVESFNFEFTEWNHVVASLVKGRGVKERWFLGNSSHVVDLAFFLGGSPEEISCYSLPGERITWHPASAIFAGAGQSDKGALFSYRANWQSAGRWQVELLTAKRRLLFAPLEKLQEQKIGTTRIEPAEGVNYALDEWYKPGIYRQTEAFLAHDDARFKTIQQQANALNILWKMANYPSW